MRGLGKLISAWATLVIVAYLLASCDAAPEEDSAPPIRGLKVFEVSQSASTVVRRYPTLIEPANESRLSFEIAGQLETVDLEEGQAVSAGDVLMRLDSTSLELEMEEARAALDQAEANLTNAQADFRRKTDLLASGNVTKAAYDRSETELRTAETNQVQASRRLDIAQEQLRKTALKAPFSGIITNVEVDSFNNVSAGQAVVTLFSQSAFEVRFNVPAAVINLVGLGDEAEVIITDLPGVTVRGRIAEVSTRASQISAFPVVITLSEQIPTLRAGMAAEALVRIALPNQVEGFLVPLSAMDFEGSETLRYGDRIDPTDATRRTGQVFVFDQDSATVRATPVNVVGARGNMLIIADGIKSGDLIAVAGVSYLFDGQPVRLLGAER